jgi:hypothetical protein
MGAHDIPHKNRLGLRLKEEIFYRMDGGSLLMAALPYLSHWLPHLSGSSMKELTQGRQLSRPLGPAFLCSQALQLQHKTVCESAVCVPETIPDKGQDVNICWYLSIPSQDR